jgi:hypothetical protein
MTSRLLERQVRLLEFLTSSAAIFGEGDDSSLDPALHGFDGGLLRLEARFSHEKRMDKIVTVFPKTFELLAGDRDAVVRAFVEACPPIDVSRLDDARQFYGCLCTRWRSVPPDPPYLRDVAACEFACLRIRVGAEDRRPEPANGRPPPRDGIRRYPGFILLRCCYDIRPIFEGDSGGAAPTKRDVPLVVGMPPGADHPRVFEVLDVVFDLLAALDDWTDPAALGTAQELKPLIGELAEHALLEVRR